MSLDPQRIGKTIAALRRRAGFSQKGLADRLFISDKAVSKWERGLSIPDIAYLGKLSVLLDIDIDTLLEGKHTSPNHHWKGFMFIESKSSEVSLLTEIYDKPLVYYLLSNFLLVGIQEILIACTEKEIVALQQLLGNGERCGVRLTYVERKTDVSADIIIKAHTAFFADSDIMTVFDSSILFGATLTYLYQRAMLNHGQHTILAIPATKLPEGKRRLYFNDSRQVTSKAALNTVYEYGCLPILFSPGNLLIDELSACGVRMPLVDSLAEKGSLFVEIANRGIIEVAVASTDDILDVSSLIKILQKHSGTYVACLEEIALRRGLIGFEQLHAAQDKYSGTQYGNYLLRLGGENHIQGETNGKEKSLNSEW